MGEPWLEEPPRGGLRLVTGPAAEASTLPLRPCSSTAFLTEGCVGSNEPDAEGKGARIGVVSEKCFEMLGVSSDSWATVPVDVGNDWRCDPNPLPSLPGRRRLGSRVSLDDHLSCVCCAFGALGALLKIWAFGADGGSLEGSNRLSRDGWTNGERSLGESCLG